MPSPRATSTWQDARCRSSWSTGRSRCSTAPGASCRWATRRRQAQACKIEFELRYAFASLALEAVRQPGVRPHRQHLRRSFVRAPSSVWRRAETRVARRSRRTARSAGAGRPGELELPDGATLRDATRAPAALCQRHAPAAKARCCSASGAACSRPTDIARARPGRDLSAAAGRPEGGAAPALRAQAEASGLRATGRRGSRRACSWQSAAMTSRARCVFFGAVLVVEDLALALVVDAGDAHARCRACAIWSRARAAVLRRGGSQPVFLGLRLGGRFLLGLLALGLELRVDRGSSASRRAAEAGRGGAAGRRGPAQRATVGRCRMSLSGTSRGGGRSLYCDLARGVAPLPLRLRPAAGQRRQAKRRKRQSADQTPAQSWSCQHACGRV